jgi:hypothetical protein
MVSHDDKKQQKSNKPKRIESFKLPENNDYEYDFENPYSDIDYDKVDDFTKHSMKLRNYLNEREIESFPVCSGTIDEIPFITVLKPKKSEDEKQESMIVSLPVTESICRSLISDGYCGQTPFGRGMETVMDTDVRKAWQIGKDQVLIHSRLFHNLLFFGSDDSPLLEQIRLTLAPNSKISAEFYKMLVYEEGDFFKAHKDTQRSEKHFGSLIVFLPSVYNGGELVIRHLGKEYSYSNSLNKYSEKEQGLHCTWVAFFADCEHELLPVRDGCRIALAFNLMFSGKKKPILPGKKDVDEEEEEEEEEAEKFSATILREHLDATFRAMRLDTHLTDYTSIGILLDHHYTQSSIKKEYLKGKDVQLYYLFQMVNDQYDIELLLIKTETEELWGGDQKYNDGKDVLRRAVEGLRDRGNNVEFTVSRCKPDEDVNRWRRTTDVLETWKITAKHKVERKGPVYFILSTDRFAGEMDEASNREGFVLGNEGTYYFNLTYTKAALIVTPKSEFQMFSSEPTDRFRDVMIVTTAPNSDSSSQTLPVMNLNNLSQFTSSKRKREENEEESEEPSSKKQHSD